MALSSLDHCSIRTAKLDETRDFYVDGHAVVHLVGIDPDDPSGLIEYLGGDIDLDEVDGSRTWGQVLRTWGQVLNCDFRAFGDTGSG